MDKPELTKTKTFVEIIGGRAGKCISLNDFRIAGSKPWGGGTVLNKFDTTVEDVLSSIAISNLPREYTFWYNGYYRVKIEKLDVSVLESEQ